ncbi:radical SAM protein [Actinomadura sp. KC345]|uniref:radical SAM/SPASM domain-containing protein n=1 Tax=Actinomadura sp. KC345 TaxID=2530371 RepID=UPI001FB81D56|nr:radical SAM protein [Actinomadura sp. KC345]
MPPPVGGTVPRMLWLDLTRKCQLQCTHCYNDSGPAGTHGTMSREDWIGVIDQAKGTGVTWVQLIGGEPTMHPDAGDLLCHALDLGMAVEVYSNLVHVPAAWWDLFQRDGVSIATSYYAADASGHNAVTGRPSHRLTRRNIVRAVQLRVPIRIGIVDTGNPHRAEDARRDLETIGVTRIRVDRVRAFGRASKSRPPEAGELCGRCGTGRASVGPTGEVSPCPMSAVLSVGNVNTTELAAILGGAAMTEATEAIRGAVPTITDCDPDGECSPGYGDSGCSPRT